MKRVLLLPLFMLLCVTAFAQPTGYVPGTQVCWNFNGRDHGYFRAAGNGERHVLVFFTGLGQTNCGNYEEHSPQKMLRDSIPGLNWDGRTVRAPGDTIVWEVFTVQNNTYVTTTVYDINYFFTHIAPIDTADRTKFHIGGVSLGVGRMWEYLGNVWNETSPYHKIFSTTISESTTLQDHNFGSIVPASYGKRNWVWHARHDQLGDTRYQYGQSLYNALGGTSKHFTLLEDTLAGHNAYTWDSCLALTGTDTLTNRWLWMVAKADTVVPPIVCPDPGGGPAGYVPGTQVVWQYNGRSHGYFRAKRCEGDERHILISFIGDSVTDSTNYQSESPQKLLNDLGPNWNGRTVRAPGDTIAWEILSIPYNSGYWLPNYASDINYFFANIEAIDTTDHSRFHIVGVSGGVGRMWGYLINDQSHNSPYRNIFSTTISVATHWFSSYTPLADYSTGRRHWVWHGANDSSGTNPPAASTALFGVLNGEKKLTMQAGAGHNYVTVDSCFSLAGTDSSNNRWIWMVQPDTSGGSLLLGGEQLAYQKAFVEKKAFSLYPNPTSTYVTLNFEASPKVNYRVTVLDLNGRIVHIEPNVKGPLYKLDVSKLRSGLYILQLEGGGTKVQLKFIKQ
ncbi:T9SS type A sorting domain-containing protein [Chitinophaga sp. SYP-B3965]|uniref:T9SS type A sorting domain-containing protein n=1 Tax=Chitinophaga sp. SYP-B3965 TaxID=2663120 RepID=UPI0015657FEA|nr:T9SS type A sorting domain-containing protein [Chitinophaga sp. SYP-B3965]